MRALTVSLLGAFVLIGGVVVLIISIGRLARLLFGHGYRLHLLFVIGAAGHLLIHGMALLLNRPGDSLWAQCFSMSLVAIAAHRGDAPSLTAPISNLPFSIRPRIWPVFGAIAFAFLTSLLVRADSSVPVTVTSAIAAGLMTVVAGRELGASHKPVLLPFSRRDRVLHRASAQLVQGQVRLSGRRVLRVADGALVGIEADADWSAAKRPGPSPRQAAREMGLEELLDHLLVHEAREHLPQVLVVLEGDEPWISIPIERELPIPPELTEANADVGGLVLRLVQQPATNSDDRLDRWRDLGAWVQVEHRSNPATKVIQPEILASNTGLEPAPMGMMSLRRYSAESASLQDLQSDGVFFAVDEADPPERVDIMLEATVRRAKLQVLSTRTRTRRRVRLPRTG